ncbi:MAG: NADH-quinone oxidoreductase subunit N [Ignavibacteria bacterium]|nr:NADH-quinone oxidoreductase subunit N [Ignavibacteria bacterium]
MINFLDFANSIPLLIIAGGGLMVMILETIFPRSFKDKTETIIFYFSLAALAAATAFSFGDLAKNFIIYNKFIRVNTLTSVLNIALIAGTFITVLSSKKYLESEKINHGEYYSLLFFSLLGMMLMCQANDLIVVFVGLELMSICFYVLAGFMRRRIESNESAIKYFLLGAFLTGFLLMGIAFIYGYTGSTNFTAIAAAHPQKDTFYLIGLTLVFIAFIFKTGAFPLQMWIPDVYQGAPTIVTGMMSSVGKTAAFGAMISFFSIFGLNDIPMVVALVAILTMLYGNVVALVQTNIKRLLAYSSIAHAGYVMVGFLSINAFSIHAILFYLVSYILMQSGAFIIISMVESKTPDNGSRNSLESYKGLGKTNPMLSLMMTIFLFSLAGIPPFAGFWGKYYIFLSAIQINYIWVAIVGILLSLVGVYYYIKIILYMWFYEPAGETVTQQRSDFSFTAAVISVIGLFAFGVYPELVLRYIRNIF